ncbi:REP element-mobilizing transposase RayT [Lewinella marina]|uniref:transposase n=1 Tax=Neolewinella marina TaxID=438751 RepID=UPI00142FE298|nr:transposase [Neolewinella marina]NJB87176.1 REP element-mobilizing transposase RayT [Neolewinella marina]
MEAEVTHLQEGDREELLRVGQNRINERHELAIDEALDALSSSTPYHLQRTDIAAIVLNSWQYLDKSGQVNVWAVCIMGNHVHVILSAGIELDEVDLGEVMERHKGFTARMANRLLGLTGSPFWEPGYFDRRIRSGKFQRVMWYVLNNPVKAKLVNKWTEWPHTWVHPEYEPMFTGVIPA